MVQMTTQEIAQKLGIDKQEAYSLVSFMEKRQFIRPCGVRKPEGGKGKGSTVYELDPALVNRMQDLLQRLFQG